MCLCLPTFSKIEIYIRRIKYIFSVDVKYLIRNDPSTEDHVSIFYFCFGLFTSTSHSSVPPGHSLFLFTQFLLR